MAEITHSRPNSEKGVGNDSVHQEKVDDAKVEVLQGSVALDIARRTNPPSPWSPQMRKLYLFMVVAYLCSALNGFDGSLMGSLLPLTQFQDTFGAGLVGSKASLIQGMYTVGGVSALPFVGYTLDTWGRRFGMFLGSMTVVLGTILGGTANEMDQLLASRFFLGWGYSMAAAAAPSYVVEMSHPAYRDLLTGLYNCQYYVGAISAAGATRACVKYPSSVAWRIPIWCQLISSGMVILTVWFIPESPRWLYSHGHPEKAWDVITKYHGEGSRENAYVLLQIREYEEAINLEGSDKRAWDFRELINTKAARWRLTCVGIAAFLSQWSQGGVTSYYIGGLLKSAGVTNPTEVLNINLGNQILSAGGAYLGSYLGPHFQRRPMMIGACVSCCICFTIFSATTGVYSKNKDPEIAKGSIGMIFLIGFCFSFGWTSLQAMYPVECLTYETRAKGMAMYSVFTNIALLVNQFGIGNAIDVIGFYTYVLLAAWNVVQAIFIYFFAVETNKRTLEELTSIFEAPNPRKESTKKHRVLVSESTNQVIEITDKGDL